jgi:hypothetical protein
VLGVCYSALLFLQDHILRYHLKYIFRFVFENWKQVDNYLKFFFTLNCFSMAYLAVLLLVQSLMSHVINLIGCI